jgi:hypothetical protein
MYMLSTKSEKLAVPRLSMQILTINFLLYNKYYRRNLQLKY